MNKTKIYWILQIGGWLLFAAINIVLSFLQDTLNEYSFVYAVLLSTWFLVSTHLFRNYIIKKEWLIIKIKDSVWKGLSGLLLLTLSNFFAHILFLWLLGVLDLTYDFDPFNIGVTLLSTLFIYFVWTLFYFIFNYVEKYNNALKYAALKNEIDLNNLKSQLNPHFIFNALNSIRALVDENPTKSKDAITQLSSILRSSLKLNKNKLTDFNEELNTVKDYLNLETIRFEERLRTNFNIDPLSKDFAVPPLMIQTLVENGIKHGISKLKAGGMISLKTEVKNSRIYISIRNNGQLSSSVISTKKGLGIENTKQRLKLLYGNGAMFRILNEDENTVLTQVVLPKEINQ